MAKFIPEIKGLTNSVVDTSKAVFNSFPQAFKQLKNMGSAPAAGASSSGTSIIGKMFFFPIKMAGKAAVWMVEQPFAWTARAARWGVGSVGKVFHEAPVLAASATVIGGALAIRGGLKSREKRHAREAEDAALDAMVQSRVSAPNSPVSAQANTYQTPQITAEDMAILNARLKGGENGPKNGHADAVNAARQQPAEAIAPSV